MKKYLITENQFENLIKYIIKEETDAEILRKQTEKEFFKQIEMEDELIKMMYKMPKVDMDTYIKWVDYDSLNNVIVYDKINKSLDIYNNKLVNYFSSKYNFKHDDIRQVFKDAVSKHYDLKIYHVML